MTIPATIALLGALLAPLHSQTVLEWALSETSPTPDVDDTANLSGTLEVPIIGDGVSSGNASTSALVGRFAPVTLANENDSITVSYPILFVGGSSGSGTNALFRLGVFNSNGVAFGGDRSIARGTATRSVAASPPTTA